MLHSFTLLYSHLENKLIKKRKMWGLGAPPSEWYSVHTEELLFLVPVSTSSNCTPQTFFLEMLITLWGAWTMGVYAATIVAAYSIIAIAFDTHCFEYHCYSNDTQSIKNITIIISIITNKFDHNIFEFYSYIF